MGVFQNIGSGFCAICGKTIVPFNNTQISDGNIICGECIKKVKEAYAKRAEEEAAQMKEKHLMGVSSDIANASLAELKAIIAQGK